MPERTAWPGIGPITASATCRPKGAEGGQRRFFFRFRNGGIANAAKQGAPLEADWNERFGAYGLELSQQAAELTRRMQRMLPQVFEAVLSATIATCVEKKENIAARKSSQNAIEALVSSLPELLGGSADLTGSNLTNWKEYGALRSGQPGDQIFTRQ